MEECEWRRSLEELMDHFHIPRESIVLQWCNFQNDTYSTSLTSSMSSEASRFPTKGNDGYRMSIYSHPDIMLLCIAALLSHFSAINTPSHDEELCSLGSVNVLISTITSVIKFHGSKIGSLYVDIHCNHSIESFLKESQAIDLSKYSFLTTIQTILDWIGGSISFFSDDGMMRLSIQAIVSKISDGGYLTRSTSDKLSNSCH
jgi:hypothetical protein